jgi:hypothetical protein
MLSEWILLEKDARREQSKLPQEHDEEEAKETNTNSVARNHGITFSTHLYLLGFTHT